MNRKQQITTVNEKRKMRSKRRMTNRECNVEPAIPTESIEKLTIEGDEPEFEKAGYRNSRTLVVGTSGSGKTTLLKKLAEDFVKLGKKQENILSIDDDQPIHIGDFIKTKEFDDESRMILATMQTPTFRSLTLEEMKKWDHIILLDHISLKDLTKLASKWPEMTIKIECFSLLNQERKRIEWGKKRSFVIYVYNNIMQLV